MSSSESRFRARLVAGIAASLAAVLPASAAAQGAPSAPSAPPPTAPATLASAGASVFALTYLASAADAATAYFTDAATASARAAMWVPFVGPFVEIGRTHSAGLDVVLVLDGLAQIAGVTMLASGVVRALPVPLASQGAAAPTATSPAVSLSSPPPGGGSGASLLVSF